MKIINKYIVKNLLLSTLVIILMVVGIDICVTFMVEQGDVGKGNFSTLSAFEYSLLCAPAHIVAGFPVLCLVGTVVGLSLLNHNNEIVIIRSNGYSLLKICKIAVITAFVLSLGITIINEWVAPMGKQLAEIRKAVAKSGGEAIISKNGFWLRAANDFIHIEKILYDGELEGVTRYRVEHDELTNIAYAEHAQYINKKWHAYNVKSSLITSEGIKSTNAPEMIWEKFLKPELLRVVTIMPEDLSLSGLYNYIKYRKENNLYYEQYELAFWQKLLQPITVMVMVFIAVPFVFSEMRSHTVSRRLVLSILIGISYFLLEKVFSSVIQVLALPVFLGALGPALSFVLLAVIWLSYNRGRLA
ncbi:MAG: LPS export ABC transporter permease LptG [Gammaproteobacteria bacterium]|nr:LPS export ABC transporter permease LptG [Gammaproteobacteria bacterium]